MGVIVGAAVVAAPLTALTLTPQQKPARKVVDGKTVVDTSKPYYAPSEQQPSDLSHIIAQGVSTTVAAATAAAGQAQMYADDAQDAANEARDRASEASDRAEAAMDRAEAARERAIDQAQAAAERARQQAYRGRTDAMRAMGMTSEYVSAMRAASPQLARVDADEMIGMKAVGVTPAYVQELAAAGLGRLSMDEIMEAKAIGLNGSYVRAAVAAGAQRDLDGLVQLKTLGIGPDKIARARAAGARSNDDIVEHAMGVPNHVNVNVNVNAPKFRGWPFQGPRPPTPPRAPNAGKPAASPPNWDPTDSGDDGS
jgi:hypothetical protein